MVLFKLGEKRLSCRSQRISLPAGPGQFGGKRPLDSDGATLRLWLGAVFTFHISICLFVASVVFMCCRFSNQRRFETQASVNAPSVSRNDFSVSQLHHSTWYTLHVFIAICELLYSQTNKLYFYFAVSTLSKRNWPPVPTTVSRMVAMKPMTLLLSLNFLSRTIHVQH